MGNDLLWQLELIQAAAKDDAYEDDLCKITYDEASVKSDWIKNKIKNAADKDPYENTVFEITAENKEDLKAFVLKYSHFKINNFYLDKKTFGTDDVFHITVYEEIENKYPYFTSRSKKKINLMIDERFKKFKNVQTYKYELKYKMPIDEVVSLFKMILKANKLGNFI